MSFVDEPLSPGPPNAGAILFAGSIASDARILLLPSSNPRSWLIPESPVDPSSQRYWGKAIKIATWLLSAATPGIV